MFAYIFLIHATYPTHIVLHVVACKSLMPTNRKGPRYSDTSANE